MIKDAELVALAEAQWIRSYVRLLFFFYFFWKKAYMSIDANLVSMAAHEMALLGNRCAAPAAAGRLAATKVYTDVQSCLRMSAGTGTKVPW